MRPGVSPLPWGVVNVDDLHINNRGDRTAFVLDANGEFVASVRVEERAANADLIVRATRHHDDLVRALRGLLRFALVITPHDSVDERFARDVLYVVDQQ